MFPVASLAGIALVSTATNEARSPSAIFTVTAALLFGVSALLHRGAWSPRIEGLLRRIDHANIYLIIAGTYTPVAALALPPDRGRTLLLIVWIGALAGVMFRLFWVGAPRWMSTMLYVVIGWVAAFYVPDLIIGAGSVAVGLIVVGGVLYSVGAIVYAMKRPNPSPIWFGFHEVFHSLTVAAFLVHYVAVWLISHA
jgi:hemolysin III